MDVMLTFVANSRVCYRCSLLSITWLLARQCLVDTLMTSLLSPHPGTPLPPRKGQRRADTTRKIGCNSREKTEFQNLDLISNKL